MAKHCKHCKHCERERKILNKSVKKLKKNILKNIQKKVNPNTNHNTNPNTNHNNNPNTNHNTNLDNDTNDNNEPTIRLNQNFSHLIKPIVNLGCVGANVAISDIIPVNVTWPNNQNPQNFATGASGPNYGSVDGDIVTNGLNLPNSGAPSSQGNNPSDPTNFISEGRPTPFQSTVYLNSNVGVYNIGAIANGYANVTLSQEGVLWTLWPLTKKKNTDTYLTNTYFNDFTFGTSMASRYPIGQMGFFYNYGYITCTPFIANSLNFNPNFPAANKGQDGMSPMSPSILGGIQGLDETLIYGVTGFIVAIVVVKIAEEVARIFNPVAGVGASDRYIYVGYDAWSIFRLSSNPVGPMMSQTYISPQSTTGSITKENLQVVIPPNFSNTIYFKNIPYNVPATSRFNEPIIFNPN